PHLIVGGVVDDERPALDAAQREGRARHACGDRRRRRDLRLTVAEQRHEAAQPAEELHIGRGHGAAAGRLCDDGGEGRVPVGTHHTPAAMSWRSTVVSCCAETSVGNHETSRSVRDSMVAVIYLLLFIAPQVLIYLYLRERLPDPSRPRQARVVRWALASLFAV